MKKISFFAAVAMTAMLAVGFSSCKDAKNSGGLVEDPSQQSGGNTSDSKEALPPDQAKEKILNVGTELVAVFKSQEQREAIKEVESIYEAYEKYDFEQVADYFDDYAEDRYSSLWKLPRYVAQVAEGKRVPSDIKAADYSFSLDKESVIFEADPTTGSWRNLGAAPDGSIILRVTDDNGKNVEAKFVGSGTVHNYKETYTLEEGGTKTVEAAVPEKLTLTITRGTEEIARLEITQNITQYTAVKTSIAAKVANLSWNVAENITDKSADMSYAVKIGSKDVVSAKFAIPTYLIPTKRSSEDFEEYAERFLELAENGLETGENELLTSVKAVTAEIDLLGEMQVKISTKDASKIYKSYATLADKYDYDLEDFFEESESTDKNLVDEICKLLNDNAVAGIYFNSSTPSAQLKFQTSYYTNEDPTYGEYYAPRRVAKETYTYYPEPIVFFPKDGTSYSYGDDFFVEANYSDILVQAQDKMNEYIKELEFFGIEPFEFYDPEEGFDF